MAQTLTDDGYNGALDAWPWADEPILRAIDPNWGPAAGGTNVSVTGNNLTGATGATVDGAAATTFVVVSDEEVTFDTPAGTDQTTVDVVVTHPDGDATLPGSFTYSATQPAQLSEASAPEQLQQATVAELEEQAEDEGIRTTSDMRKDDLVDAVAARRARREELDAMTVDQLQDHAQSLGMSGFWDLRKEDLVAEIHEVEVGQEEGDGPQTDEAQDEGDENDDEEEAGRSEEE